MAKTKVKCLRVRLLGTGLNTQFYCATHEVKAFNASTYHVFTYLNGVEVWKNDFGVSSIFIERVEIDPDEAATPQQF